jgi:hypothetical protein
VADYDYVFEGCREGVLRLFKRYAFIVLGVLAFVVIGIGAFHAMPHEEDRCEAELRVGDKILVYCYPEDFTSIDVSEDVSYWEGLAEREVPYSRCRVDVEMRRHKVTVVCRAR